MKKFEIWMTSKQGPIWNYRSRVGAAQIRPHQLSPRPPCYSDHESPSSSFPLVVILVCCARHCARRLSNHRYNAGLNNQLIFSN